MYHWIDHIYQTISNAASRSTEWTIWRTCLRLLQCGEMQNLWLWTCSKNSSFLSDHCNDQFSNFKTLELITTPTRPCFLVLSTSLSPTRTCVSVIPHYISNNISRSNYSIPCHQQPNTLTNKEIFLTLLFSLIWMKAWNFIGDSGMTGWLSMQEKCDLFTRCCQTLIPDWSSSLNVCQNTGSPS